MSMPEKKLDKFSSAVLKDAEEQRSKILEEIEEYRKSQMEKAEEEILHEAYIMIQNEIASIKNKHSRKISLSELEGRRNLLILREELSGKVFDESAKYITEFTKTEEYKDYMCGLVKKCCEAIPAGSIEIKVKKDDLALSDTLVAASGRDAKVIESVNINLGGVLVSNTAKGIVMDETLDLKLSSQKDWFASESGLSIGM
jgi:V/A-type H+-transporting ATPase subunit E